MTESLSLKAGANTITYQNDGPWEDGVVNIDYIDVGKNLAPSRARKRGAAGKPGAAEENPAGEGDAKRELEAGNSSRRPGRPSGWASARPQRGSTRSS